MLVLFRALGNQVRLDILDLLKEEGPLSQREIEGKLENPPLGVWNHLQALVGAGLLQKLEDSRRDITYSINPDGFDSLHEWSRVRIPIGDDNDTCC